MSSQCNGMCLTGSDIGVYGSGVAYAHPTCPRHGEECTGFLYDHADKAGRELCARCRGIRAEHREEAKDPEVRRKALTLEVSLGYPDNISDLFTVWRTFGIEC